MQSNVPSHEDNSNHNAELPPKIAATGKVNETNSELSESDGETTVDYVVLVAKEGKQILMRYDGDGYSCLHDIIYHGTSYGSAHLLREEICLYFGISAHTYIAANLSLIDEAKDCRYMLKILEATGNLCAVAAPFEWVYWRAFDGGFDRACPHPIVARFLKCYLSNMDVDEINRAVTPWRQVGFYSSAFPRIQELISNAGYQMRGMPEQVHVGSLSTVFKILTDKGTVFFKAGVRGNGEPQKTKVITALFPDDTARLLAMDLDMEFMVSKDHGPAVHELYIVKKDERPALGESEMKSLFSCALMQWAGVQRKSVGCLLKLIANGVPRYDKSWIRAGFLELLSYMKEVKLDTEYDVTGCNKQMEETFESWDSFRMPSTLVHGDLHEVNIAQPGGLGSKLIFFDWDHAFIGHPFLELYFDETWDLSLGEDAYLECWEDYGSIESLKRLVVRTKPARFVIEAVRELRREVWTDEQRRKKVEEQLEALSEALDRWETMKREERRPPVL